MRLRCLPAAGGALWGRTGGDACPVGSGGGSMAADFVGGDAVMTFDLIDAKFDRTLDLDGSLSRAELAEAFEGLRFHRAEQRLTVRIDRDVAAYLARLLRKQR
jgi:hypothetical protein